MEQNVKQYWRRYRFQSDPFELTKPKHFFVPNIWNDYLDLLKQFLLYCNSLIIVEGVTGIGKTSLVKQFIIDNNDDANIVLVNAAECQNKTSLLELLHQHFDTPYDPNNEENLTEQIEQQIDHLKLNKAPRMLIIDDAEHLPLEMRQACLQIVQQQTELDTCLPIILLGKVEELAAQYYALLTTKTAENCIHRIQIQPFTKQETEDYLIWACEQVGEQNGKSPFSREEMATIHRTSNGIIANINQTARNLLTTKDQHSNKQPQLILNKKLIWWGCTLMLIIALLFLYQYLTRPKDTGVTFTKPIALRAQSSSTPNVTQVDNMIIKPKEPTVNAKQKAPKKPPVIKTTSTHNLFNTVMQQKLSIHHQKILRMNPEHYTIQLMAAKSLHTAEQFISKYQLQATAMIAKTKRNNKEWYLVLYGVFNNRQQAKENLKLIQPQLQQLKPWYRSFASVQKYLIN